MEHLLGYAPPLSNKGNGKGFRAEELAENIKLRGRTGKTTKKLSLAFQNRTGHKTKTDRLIKE